MYFFKILLMYLCILHSMWGILAPQPGMEPMLRAMEAQTDS